MHCGVRAPPTCFRPSGSPCLPKRRADQFFRPDWTADDLRLGSAPGSNSRLTGTRPMRLKVAAKRLALFTAGAAIGIQPLPAFAQAADAVPVRLAVDANRVGPKINRDIFGQFAEHLGTGIYGGIWVGPNS